MYGITTSNAQRPAGLADARCWAETPMSFVGEQRKRHGTWRT